MKEFIANLRQKPEHIRKRIAVGTSVGVTGLVGLIWITAMATTGAFALSTPNTEGTETPAEEFALSGTNVQSNFSQLMGAVGAAAGATSSDPELKIVDGDTSSSFEKEPSPNQSVTVIPF